jgi:drug/metabolite transporter (DMT)-like permease
MQSSGSHVGELMALRTALTWSLGMFPFTEAAKRLGVNALNLFRLVLAVLLLGIATLLFTNISFIHLFTSPNQQHWLWLGISGIIGIAIGDYCAFSAFILLGTRLTSVFNTLSPAAALLFGFIINHDHINLIGISGMAITIGGIMWLSLSQSEKHKVSHLSPAEYTKGIIFAVLSAVTQGIGVALSQRGLSLQIDGENINTIHAAFIRMIAATVGVLFIAVFSGRIKQFVVPALANQNKGIGYAIIATIVGPVIGMALSMQAVSMTSASVAQTIFSLLPVFVLILAHFFYDERITARSFLGAVIAIVGVVILIWRDGIIGRLHA